MNAETVLVAEHLSHAKPISSCLPKGGQDQDRIHPQKHPMFQFLSIPKLWFGVFELKSVKGCKELLQLGVEDGTWGNYCGFGAWGAGESNYKAGNSAVT